MNKTEEWRIVARAPKYKVSNWGRVIGARGRILRPVLRSTYHSVRLYPNPDEFQSIAIHILVLEAFVGPRPHGCYGCHYDGDPLNNKLPNLRWATPAENTADQKRHGTFVSGTRNGGAKFTMAEIRQIRSEHQPKVSGRGCLVLARKYGVGKTTMRKILNGSSYVK